MAIFVFFSEKKYVQDSQAWNRKLPKSEDDAFQMQNLLNYHLVQN